jgi:Protein of unknown function (DUF1579)
MSRSVRRPFFVALAILLLSFAIDASAQTTTAPPAQGLTADINRPPQMDRLLPLAGTWKMTPSYFDPRSRQWVDGAVFHALFVPRYDGRYLHSEFVLPMPGLPAFMMDWTLSYDRYRNTYRMAVLENVVGLMDIYEGEWQGDALLLDDKRTGTSAPGVSGRLMFARFVFRFDGPTRMRITMQTWQKDVWVDHIRIVMDKAAL